MPEELLDYICSTWEAANPSGEKHRIDLVHPSDREAFGRQVHEILHVKNAPLGKWPSRFSSAFMQQTAINLAIKKGKTPLFQENGEVFSVNGPPGTGKTTLLKEIIVSNIVERSALLAQYEDPEDAFERHSFLHGPKAGHAYSQYTRHWYSLKNEKIHDYSVLVTSCNNAAVENISKELPLGSGILKDLKPLEGDSQEAKAALSEVSGLFDFTRSLETECYEKKRVEYPDIYFTYYAQKLLQEKMPGSWLRPRLAGGKISAIFIRRCCGPCGGIFIFPIQRKNGWKSIGRRGHSFWSRKSSSAVCRRSWAASVILQ